MTDKPAPVFGLLVAYRAYECTCCGHRSTISTNHTDVCFDSHGRRQLRNR